MTGRTMAFTRRNAILATVAMLMILGSYNYENGNAAAGRTMYGKYGFSVAALQNGV